MSGQFKTAVTHCNKEYEVDIFVISGEHASNLLGRQAACEMGLVAKLDEVDAEFFGDIGLLKCEPVRIQLDKYAEPYGINTARRIPFPESAKLTTFITPSGRFCFKRLPFGITCAPEIFQGLMTDLLKKEKVCEAIMDDIIVYGKSVEDHDENMHKTLQIIKESGLILNKNKFEFRKSTLNYFGPALSVDGVSPDPGKVKAIRELPAPTNVPELRRVIGMINYLGRFIPNLAAEIHSMTELLKSDRVWT